mgnify:CR=1 FL=1
MKTIIILSLSLLLTLSFNSTANERPIVSQAQLVSMQQATSNSGFLLLDVRSSEEYAQGHIKGAVNISHKDIADKLATIADYKDKEVIVYCRSGRRAGLAEEILAANGFNKVKHLSGDMNAWYQADLPVEK